MNILLSFGELHSQSLTDARESTSPSAFAPGFSDLELKYDVKYYFIDLAVNDTSTNISGNTLILVESLESIDSIIFELDQTIQVDSVFVDGSKSGNYVHSGNLLSVIPAEPTFTGEETRIKVYYSGGESAGGFFTGITNRKDFKYQADVTYTLSEPFQASMWFPVKQDLGDKADSVRVHITVDSSLMAGSNGLLERIVSLEDGRKRFEWVSNYTVAYYLVSFAVADYQDYSFYAALPERSDSLLVQNFVYDHPELMDLEKEKIDRTSDLLYLFSELLGTYPFYKEKYGHCMAPMGGGMEHQTMTTLQTFNFELVAHELGHQWFGDYVTCSGWQDIWINEGFASYCEYLALEHLEGLEQAVNWMEGAHGAALRIDDGSIFMTEEDATDPIRIFSLALTYKKGAAILHMLRNEINDDEVFYEVLRTFLDNYKNGVAGAEEFNLTVNTVTGENFDYFFDQWYYGKGYPVFQAGWKQAGDSLWINTSQTGSSEDTPFFRTHIDFEISFADGTDTLVRVLQDSPEKLFTLYTGKAIRNIRLDPYARVLMKSFIYEHLPENDIVEYGPNPFEDKLYLNFLNYLSGKTIRITDLEGKLVFLKEFGATRELELNLGFLSSGLYFMIIEDEDYTVARKILKI